MEHKLIGPRSNTDLNTKAIQSLSFFSQQYCIEDKDRRNICKDWVVRHPAANGSCMNWAPSYHVEARPLYLIMSSWKWYEMLRKHWPGRDMSWPPWPSWYHHWTTASCHLRCPASGFDSLGFPENSRSCTICGGWWWLAIPFRVYTNIRHP